MKIQHILPIITAAVGFAIAWTAKPAANAPASDSSQANEIISPNKTSRNERPRMRSESVAERQPTEVNPGDFPLVEQHENGPRTRRDAKIVRLTEALGLTSEQQEEIIQIVEDAKSVSKEGASAIENLSIRGKQIEDSLSKTLSPEQFEKFQEIRARERDNRIEILAQRSLAQVITEIDLSPGQRDAALARLRQSEKEKIQEIPAAATLMLKNSILPTEANGMTIESLLTFNMKSALNTAPGNAEDAQMQILLRHKQKIETKLRCFEGILSPGQMSQYNAMLIEQKTILPPGFPQPTPR